MRDWTDVNIDWDVLDGEKFADERQAARLLDDAVANKDVDLLIWLAMLYVGALLLSSTIKLAMRIQRELISARIVHALRRSVYYHIYTVTPPSLLKASAQGDDVVDEGAVVSMLSSERSNRQVLSVKTLLISLSTLFMALTLVYGPK